MDNNLACGAVGGIDASINGLSVPNLGCSTTKDIIFNLQSFGDTLTEATINYSINGESSSINWVGNLGFAESEVIIIPNVNIEYGISDIEANVEILGDIYEDNNTNTLQINNYEGTFIDITIEFDALPYGFEWSLYNSDTEELIDEGGYYDNEVYACEVETNTYCLEEGNYILVLEDLFGNGMFYPCGGPTSIINGNDTLNTVTGNWGDEEILPFYVGPPDPCPLSDCPWDVDGNGYVWTNDILVILQYYGLETECSPFDINQDGVVGVDDILDAITNFNTECTTGELTPEGGFDVFLKNEQEGELVTTTLYNMMGQKVQEGNHLDTGIYIIVKEWNVPEVGVFVTKEKIFRE